MPNRTKPLYVSVATALKHLVSVAEESSQFTQDYWEHYLTRCEKELPLNAKICTEAKKDLIYITGAFHPYGNRTHADYWVKVTPSLADGFYLRIGCNDRNLRELIHESFSDALAREWPVSQFFEKEIEPCPS